jgi:ABC-type transport system involved in cytochrome bd biosynthesis fused ATPase/permease subunit
VVVAAGRERILLCAGVAFIVYYQAGSCSKHTQFFERKWLIFIMAGVQVIVVLVMPIVFSGKAHKGGWITDLTQWVIGAGVRIRPDALQRKPALSIQLVVQHHSKVYTENRGLLDTGFNVERGELIAVVGHNGSGKSTLRTGC